MMMSDFAAVLVSLGRHGGEVALDVPGRTKLFIKPGRAPAATLQRLPAYRDRIVTLLREGFQPPSVDARYIFDERLLIAEWELAMPVYIGSPAWLIATGESMRKACESTSTSVEWSDETAAGHAAKGNREESREPVSNRQGIRSL